MTSQKFALDALGGEQLSSSVNSMETFLTEKTNDASLSFKTTGLFSKEDALGAAQSKMESESITQLKAKLAVNPIAQAGIDTLTQMGTTIVQQIVGDALKKINLSPIQNATQNFFQAWATVSTFDTEVAMELARNTARNIQKVLTQKNQVIAEIQAEITALHNACVIILNSSPFIDKYFQDLVAALNILKRADGKFTNVYKGLTASATASRKFNSITFNSGIADLEAAQVLILPDRNANISSIRDVTDFVSTTIQRPTTMQAIAAAQSIPGMTLKLGTKMIEYIKLTVEVNLLLNTFLDALDGWISSYKKSSNIYDAVASHVAAGKTQLEDLIAIMQSTLYPSAASGLDVTSLTYGATLSANATAWGVKNQAVIEWMKLNPGKGAALVDQTSNSVTKYLDSVNLIKTFGNMPYSGGTFVCTEGREDGEVAVRAVAKLMLRVNTILATRQTRTQITTEFRSVRNFFQKSLANDQRLASSLNIFLSTSNTLPGPARKILSDALGIANKYGLDRVAGLINDGKVRELFNVTPDTSTFAGSAVVGMSQLVSLIRSNPEATDAQVSRIESARDVLVADKTSKDIEANRSYSSTVNAVQEEIKKKLDEIKSIIQPGIEAAKALDTNSGTSLQAKTETTMSSVISGFNNNRSLSEVS